MVILPSLPQKGANPSMYIEYENVFLGIYMIYLSLLCECQLHYWATGNSLKTKNLPFAG